MILDVLWVVAVGLKYCSGGRLLTLVVVNDVE
jgi:hypothetical protein